LQSLCPNLIDDLLEVKQVTVNALKMHNHLLVSIQTEGHLDLHVVFKGILFNLVAVSVNNSDLVFALVVDLRHLQNVSVVTNQLLFLIANLNLVALEEVFEETDTELRLLVDNNVFLSKRFKSRKGTLGDDFLLVDVHELFIDLLAGSVVT